MNTIAHNGARWRAWRDGFAQDCRHAARSFRHHLGFNFAAAVALALGIGACTVVYSVIDNLLLRPIGHDAHTEREVQLFETRLPGVTSSRVAPANFLDWQKRATSFSAMRAGSGANLVLTGEGEPLRLVAGKSTQDLLGPHAWTLAAGRGFLPEEDQPGKNKVVVVGYGLWRGALHGDAQVIGRALQINGEPYTIVGVLSEEVSRFLGVDAFTPMALSDQERQQRGNRSLGVWARLKPGVTVEAARAEMNLIAAQLAREHPDTNAGWGISITPVSELQGGAGLRQALWMLLGAVGCVLLIASANVANLFLAQATMRQQEMALRCALGAGRGRLVQQLLVESLLVALLGGAIGVLLAHWGLEALHGYAGAGMQRLGYVELNRGVLGWAVALSAGTGVLVGLAPALFATRIDLNGVLKQGGRGAVGRSRGWVRSALVVVEVALATILLAGAAALTRRLVERTRLHPGFDAQGAVVMQVNLVPQKYPGPAPRLAFAEEVRQRLAVAPGVRAVGITTALPTPPPAGIGFSTGGSAAPPAEWPRASLGAVSPDYFAAMGIQLIRGRGIAARDAGSASPVVVINQTLARQYFPGVDPIGRRIAIASKPNVWREVVGVAGDVTEFGADLVSPPQIYEPLAQNPGANLSFVVRTAGDAASIFGSLKQQVYAIDKDQPVLSVQPLRAMLDDRVAGQRFTLHMLAVFSSIATVIAALGIYAVLAYVVSQRTNEIGIRRALGAQFGDVLWLVLGFGGRLMAAGLALGVVGAFAFGRVVRSMLYGVETHDPATLAVVVVLFLGVGALACLVPARRATKVDPAVALRAE
jgi:predicted permease